MSLSEKSVQGELMFHVLRKLGHRFALVNNTGIFGWEADVLSLTTSGRVYEWEIKISRSDLLADAGKHKHDRIRWGARGPAYFSYVCPEEIVRVDDALPEYAGVVTFSIRHTKYYGSYPVFYTMKRAKKLHDAKLGERELGKIARYLSFSLAKTLRDRYPLITENGHE